MNSHMVFVSGQQEDYSIIIEYQSIGVHAVTHEPVIWNRPCIYCQISQPGDEEDEGFGIMCGETEFDTMLEDAKNGKFDIILTKSISQFSENVVELLTIVRDLRQHDVAVYFEEESINTSALNSELLLTVFAELKEEERMVC